MSFDNNNREISLMLEVVLDQHATQEENHNVTKDLFDELSQDIDQISMVQNEKKSDGAKGDPVTIEGLLLAITVASVPGVFTLLRSWMTRRYQDTLSIRLKLGDEEIELKKPGFASPEEVEEWIDKFAALLHKHGKSEDDKD